MNLEASATVIVARPGLEDRADPEPEEVPKTGRLVRVALVDDHRIVLDGLRELLSHDHRVRIVGEATNGRDALELVRKQLPDVVLMDVVMPEMDGIQATQMIKAEFPQVGVVGLSMFSDEDTRQHMLRAGACAHLGKEVDLTVLLAALFDCVQ